MRIRYYSQGRLAFATKLLSVLLAVAVLLIPVFVLLWISLNRTWMTVTVLVSVMIFSTMLCLFTQIRIQEVLVGSAAYCAVLATFLGNLQQRE